MANTTEVDAAILKLYKRLQNGSDVRGIAVDGEQLYEYKTAATLILYYA